MSLSYACLYDSPGNNCLSVTPYLVLSLGLACSTSNCVFLILSNDICRLEYSKSSNCCCTCSKVSLGVFSPLKNLFAYSCCNLSCCAFIVSISRSRVLIDSSRACFDLEVSMLFLRVLIKACFLFVSVYLQLLMNSLDQQL